MTAEGAGPWRVVEVDPERLPRWVTGFAARHGRPEVVPVGDGLRLTAPDGAVAELLPWSSRQWRVSGSVEDALVRVAEPPGRLALVLVRRGGYAVGLGEGDRLVRHHCGTRYVQSRTAAGGWSQQRFARRRGNQADALVGSVVGRVRTLLDGVAPDALVVGGDRTLVRRLLDADLPAGLADLPRRELPDLPDPRLAVLRQALRRGRACRVRLSPAAG